MLPWMEMPTKLAILDPGVRQCPGVFYWIQLSAELQF